MVVFAMLLGAAVGSASEPPRATVVLAGDANYAPFQFIDAQGKATGFDVELFRALARQQHLDPVIHLGDWRDAFDGLDNGTVDAVPMFITPERRQRYLFSRPFLIRYHLVFGRRGESHISDLADLTGRRVAVQFDSTALEALRDLKQVVQIVPSDVEGGALVAVHEGRADFALAPIEIGYKSIIEHGYHDVVAVSPPLLERDYAFAVSHDDTALLARINAGLAALRGNGTQDALYLKWLANLAPGQVAHTGNRVLWWVLFGLAALVIAILLLLRLASREARIERKRAAAETRSRENAEALVEHLAWHDPTTDLPNLHALLVHAQTAIDAQRPLGLVRLDILNLNLAQSTAGSQFTEELLRALAARLDDCNEGGMVAALGRGLFGIALDSVQSNREAVERLHALVEAAQQPLTLGELTLRQRCRAGLAYFPLDARDAEGLLRAAETACSAAHEHATTMMAYEESLEPDPRNLTLLADLADAIENDTLGAALQPKIALKDGRFCGAELLVRWQHPRYGPMAPGQFVPLAEKTGAIGDLTQCMVRKAIREWQSWRDRGVELHVAVNISGADLANEGLIDNMAFLFADIGPALTLEITETEMIRDPRRALAAVAELRATGVRISLDDFGTGYSSFITLRQLAPDELKIDRSFTAHLLDSPGDRSIARACIALAHELDAVVVAEGVEDAATLAWLAEHDCDMAQGYIVAPAMSGDALFARYAANHPVSP
ncbi:MAG TPA: EAL domain-containing protein [Rhodanobacteraceae bacterium]|nr:EAL domain-containing protein [Rhodanobacteraceae bacterium]